MILLFWKLYYFFVKPKSIEDKILKTCRLVGIKVYRKQVTKPLQLVSDKPEKIDWWT